MNIIKANVSPLQYWRETRYSMEDVDNVCKSVNDSIMVARVVFNSEGNVEITISDVTWSKQEGHYPAIMKLFKELSERGFTKGLKGSLIVWLEDGMWEWHQEYSTRAPVLAFGRHIFDSRTFLMPDPAFFHSKGYETELQNLEEWESETSWEEKIPTVFWRGAATGLAIEQISNWVNTPRGRLVLYAKTLKNSEILDASITKINHLPGEVQDALLSNGVVDDYLPLKDFFKYRYLIDADGYCCAWISLFLKLASKSTTLKIESEFEQWYFSDMIPWVHYVPLRPDLYGFEETFNWLRKYDDKARKIAEQGRAFAQSITYERCLEEIANTCRAILECCEA